MSVILSPLLSEPATQPLRVLDLTASPKVPAWITDPNLIASILAGHIDIPDDLAGGA